MPPKTRSLPKKRSPPGSPVSLPEDDPPSPPGETQISSPPLPKKSKAELRRESLSRAKEWAADRKRKTAAGGGGGDEDEGEDAKKSKPDDVVAEEEEEAAFEVEEEKKEEATTPDVKPPSRSTRSTRRRAASSRTMAAALADDDDGDDAVVAIVATQQPDEESVGSTRVRRSTRRRTMGASKETETPTRNLPVRSSRRKAAASDTTPTVVEEEETAVDEGDEKEEAAVPVIKAEEPELKPEEDVPDETEMERDNEDMKVVEEAVAQEVEKEIEETQEDVKVAAETDDREVKEETLVEEESVLKNEEEDTVEKEEDVEIESTHFSTKKIIEEENHTTEAKSEVVKTGSNESSVVPKYESPMESLISWVPSYFHCFLVVWTLAFAVMMLFCFDWWLYHMGPPLMGPSQDGESETFSEQRASCFILGLWLVTVAIYTGALGPHSETGWILAGASWLAVAFSTKMMALSGIGTFSAPSLPVCTFSDFEVNMPSMTVFWCILGYCFSVSKQPRERVQEQPQASAVETEDDVAPQAESAEQNQDEAFPEASTGPGSFIGQRVAIEKDFQACLGTVKGYDSETRQWLVRYDDESQKAEELNRVQLGSAFKLYSKHLADNLKEMWRAGEL